MIRTLREIAEGIEMGDGYEAVCCGINVRQPTKFGYLLLALIIYIKHEIILARICRWQGHDMECDDWAGPDSGGMAGHCKRCGFSFSHILY
jgi:hypothetical protein